MQKWLQNKDQIDLTDLLVILVFSSIPDVPDVPSLLFAQIPPYTTFVDLKVHNVEKNSYHFDCIDQ